MLTKPRHSSKTFRSPLNRRKRRHFSPLMFIGMGVTVLIALIGAGLFVVLPRLQSHAAGATNASCTLTIPANPLSAQGLATPYQLTATNTADGPCNEANVAQSAFVQADILDPATGQITTYEPLVVDQGTQPAIAPVVPKLPTNAVVGIWFGFNATYLTLHNNARTRGQTGSGTNPFFQMFTRGGTNGNCVNGIQGSPFGQFAYCNAVNFFWAANAAIRAGRLHVPALGTGSDGKACPTTRSFALVDMDQSDNVQTNYLVTANGQTAQFSSANQAKLPGATVLGNPSDNALLTQFVDPALGCKPWTVPDLTNNNAPVATFGTDELMAAADQQAPVALVPVGDEMVQVNGQTSLFKTDLYRAGADQMPALTLQGASTTTYCQNLIKVALPSLQLDTNTFQKQASPDAGAANSLYTFLANRLNATLGAGGLNCVGLLNIQNPVTLTADGNGVVTAATIATTPVPANGGGAPTPTAPATGTAPVATPTTPTGTVPTPVATPTAPTGTTPVPTPTGTAPAVTPTATP